MSRLWKDSGVQAAFLRANEYQLSDCAKYFLDHVTRLGQHGYIPTTQDILHTRVRTSGIVEVKFHIKDMIFRIHDVGGQRSERRKWLYLFDCVHAVIFCVSLTNYCQKAGDDSDMNKMHEAIKVWSQIQKMIKYILFHCSSSTWLQIAKFSLMPASFFSWTKQIYSMIFVKGIKYTNKSRMKYKIPMISEYQ